MRKLFSYGVLMLTTFLFFSVSTVPIEQELLPQTLAECADETVSLDNIDYSYQFEEGFIGPVSLDENVAMDEGSCLACYFAFFACSASAIDGSSCAYIFEACKLLYC